MFVLQTSLCQLHDVSIVISNIHKKKEYIYPISGNYRSRPNLKRATKNFLELHLVKLSRKCQIFVTNNRCSGTSLTRTPAEGLDLNVCIFKVPVLI